MAFSPVVSGEPTSMIQGVGFHWFPLSNPGIVSVRFKQHTARLERKRQAQRLRILNLPHR